MDLTKLTQNEEIPIVVTTNDDVDSRYLKHALSRTFFPVPATFTVYFPIKCLTMSNYSLSRTNFFVPRNNYSHYLKLFRKCNS